VWQGTEVGLGEARQSKVCFGAEPLGMVWQGIKAGPAGQGVVSLDLAGNQGLARLGTSRQAWVQQGTRAPKGTARCGKLWYGVVRQGIKAGSGTCKARRGVLGPGTRAACGADGLGLERLDVAGN